MRSSAVMGVLLTGLNPFFVAWWLTVGSRLVLDAVIQLSILGGPFVFLSHTWMDYAWLTLLSQGSTRARSFIGSRAHRALIFAFTLVILGYGMVFLARALQ